MSAIRPSPMRRAGKQVMSVLALCAGLLNAGCVLKSGVSCNNADVKASIAEDALTSVAEAANQPVTAEELANQLHDYTLHNTFEVSREGSVAICHGTLGSLKGLKGLPDYPLDYTVTKSDDGNVLYNFDKARFGPILLGLIIMQSTAAKAKADEQGAKAAGATPRTTQPAPVPSSGMTMSADPNWSQWRR